MLIRTVRLVLALLITLLISAPALASGNGTIVIGQVIDLSGPTGGALGRDYVAGIKTFIDRQNALGGIGSRRIEYVVVDDRGEPATAAAAAKTLITQNKPDFLLGGVGEACVRAVLSTPEFRNSGLLMFAPLAGMLDSDRILRWRAREERELAFLLRHFQRSGIKTVAVALQDGEANAALVRALPVLMKETGLEMTRLLPLRKEPELAATAKDLAAAPPGLVLVLADTVGTGLFLAQYRKLQPAGFVAGTSMVDLSTLKEMAPASLEWTVLSQVVPDHNALASKLQLEHRDMMRKYRDEPASALTFEGYAVARTLALLVERNALPRTAGMQSLKLQGPLDVDGMRVNVDARVGSLSAYLDVALLRGSARLRY